MQHTLRARELCVCVCGGGEGGPDVRRCPGESRSKIPAAPRRGSGTPRPAGPPRSPGSVVSVPQRHDIYQPTDANTGARIRESSGVLDLEKKYWSTTLAHNSTATNSMAQRSEPKTGSRDLKRAVQDMRHKMELQQCCEQQQRIRVHTSALAMASCTDFDFTWSTRFSSSR